MDAGMRELALAVARYESPELFRDERRDGPTPILPLSDVEEGKSILDADLNSSLGSGGRVREGEGGVGEKVSGLQERRIRCKACRMYKMGCNGQNPACDKYVLHKQPPKREKQCKRCRRYKRECNGQDPSCVKYTLTKGNKPNALVTKTSKVNSSKNKEQHEPEFEYTPYKVTPLFANFYDNDDEPILIWPLGEEPPNLRGRRVKCDSCYINKRQCTGRHMSCDYHPWNDVDEQMEYVGEQSEELRVKDEEEEELRWEEQSGVTNEIASGHDEIEIKQGNEAEEVKKTTDDGVTRSQANRTVTRAKGKDACQEAAPNTPATPILNHEDNNDGSEEQAKKSLPTAFTWADVEGGKLPEPTADTDREYGIMGTEPAMENEQISEDFSFLSIGELKAPKEWLDKYPLPVELLNAFPEFFSGRNREKEIPQSIGVWSTQRDQEEEEEETDEQRISRPEKSGAYVDIVDPTPSYMLERKLRSIQANLIEETQICKQSQQSRQEEPNAQKKNDIEERIRKIEEMERKLQYLHRRLPELQRMSARVFPGTLAPTIDLQELEDESALPKAPTAQEPTKHQGRVGRGSIILRCSNCKKRRIKCDKRRPECQQCARSGLHCGGIPCSDRELQITPVIDFGKVRKWRAQCETSHGDCCNKRYSEALAQQLERFLLVDVVSGNLVALPTSTKFVALSYVWGNVPMLKSGKDNINELKKPGALFREPYKSVIPNTIRDAMHVVKASGEQYLWVDCLSIIQDSEKEEMDKMLKAMARIYASAEFTIVAAEGRNADSGLRGVGGLSQERVPVEWITNTRKEGGNVFPWHSRWASRGWTFQETLFSRRLLVIDTAISWICGRLIRMEYEDLATTEHLESATVWPSERPHLGIPMGMMSLIPKKPSLGRWGMIIENFSTRNLTYEQDNTGALAGATEVMSSTFPGGLYRGLPLFFFDIALLWQPKSTLERRHSEPSWSWMGWKGAIECLLPWQPFYPGVYRKSGLPRDWIIVAPLKPLAVWSLACQDEHYALYSGFLNGFHEYQAMRYDSERTLPAGWVKHTHPDGDFFTDSEHAKTNFRYAYPLPSTDNSWEIAQPPSGPILLCTAPVATVSLRLTPEAWIGVFAIVHNGICIGSLKGYSTSGYERLSIQPCSLIAISAGEFVDVDRARDQPQFAFYFSAIDRHPWIGRFSQSPQEPDDREFYNVLWIEKDDGIAYRRGLGIVSKRQWDRIGAKVETIELG